MTKFAKSLKLDFPILSDAKRTASKAYGVTTGMKPVPSRRTFYIGKDGKLLQIDRKVKVKSHGADVANNLKKLGVEKAASTPSK